MLFHTYNQIVKRLLTEIDMVNDYDIKGNVLSINLSKLQVVEMFDSQRTKLMGLSQFKNVVTKNI